MHDRAVARLIELLSSSSLSGARLGQAAARPESATGSRLSTVTALLVAALQFVEGKASRKRFANASDIAWRCRTIGFEKGVIIRSIQGRMIRAPALVAGRSEQDEILLLRFGSACNRGR